LHFLTCKRVPNLCVHVWLFQLVSLLSYTRYLQAPVYNYCQFIILYYINIMLYYDMWFACVLHECCDNWIVNKMWNTWPIEGNVMTPSTALYKRRWFWWKLCVRWTLKTQSFCLPILCCKHPQNCGKYLHEEVAGASWRTHPLPPCRARAAALQRSRVVGMQGPPVCRSSWCYLQSVPWMSDKGLIAITGVENNPICVKHHVTKSLQIGHTGCNSLTRSRCYSMPHNL